MARQRVVCRQIWAVPWTGALLSAFLWRGPHHTLYVSSFTTGLAANRVTIPATQNGVARLFATFTHSLSAQAVQQKDGQWQKGHNALDHMAVQRALDRGNVQQAYKELARIKRQPDVPRVREQLYQNIIESCHCQRIQRRDSPLLNIAQKALEFYLRDHPNPSTSALIKAGRRVLQATARVGDVDGALTLLQLLRTYCQAYLDEHIFFLVLRCLADARRMSAAEPLIRQLDELGISRSLYIYSTLLKGYGNQRWVEKVMEVEGELQARGVQPDLVTLNCMLDAYARCDEIGRLTHVLQRMRVQEGDWPKPDVYSYNIVMRALGQRRDVTAVLSLHREMRAAGVEPDAVTINTIVSACAKASLLMKGYRLLKSSQQLLPGGADFDRNALLEGYSALLNGFVVKGQIDMAHDVLQGMQAVGIVPNVYIYTTLIKGAAQRGNSTQVMDIFHSMRTQGQQDKALRPNVYTYNTVMSHLVKQGRIDDVLQLRRQMQEVGTIPDTVTCNIILDGYLRADPPRTSSAEAFFLEMLEKGPKPDQYTFSTLLRAYQPLQPEAVAPGSPLAVLQHVIIEATTAASRAASIATDTAAQEALLTSAAAAELQQKAVFANIASGPDRIYRMMRSSPDLLLDVAVINALIMAFLRKGAMRSALQIFDNFKTGKMTTGLPPGQPDVITYSILIKGVALSDNMYAGAKIMQLYKEMREQYNILPDLSLAQTLVNSFVRARSRVGGMELDNLDEVFEDLRRLGWKEETVAKLEEQATVYEGLLSEAWKEGPRRRRTKSVDDSISSQLWRKYSWNQFDSSYRSF